MAKAKMAKAKDKETVSATAIKELLKEHKSQTVQATVVENLDGAELPITIKTRAKFSEICDIALDIVERCENAAISRGKNEPMQEIALYGFISQYVIVSFFTNVDLSKVDADTAREFLVNTNVVDLVHGSVDPSDLNDIETIAINTIAQKNSRDTLSKIWKKLSGILDKVDASVDDTVRFNFADVLNKLSKVADLDEEKIVEAVLNNGADGTGHNDDASGVRG